MAQDKQVLVEASRAQAEAADKVVKEAIIADSSLDSESKAHMEIRVYELRMRALELEVAVDTRDILTHIENRLAELVPAK